jgi:glycosyltransferase involved in cell wall biosynthesis
MGATPDMQVVLFFGNVRPYKGLRDLIEAWPRVRAEQNTLLVVAGTFFESIDSYKEQIHRLGVSGSVRLFDEYIPNEDIPALFALSDLLVLPYRSASQSGVIPLAASFGKPVVTTNVGGLPEALAGTGVVVPPNNPSALGAAVIHALQDSPPPPPTGHHLWREWRNAVLSS